MKEDRFGPMVSEASVQSVDSIVSGPVRRQKHPTGMQWERADYLKAAWKGEKERRGRRGKGKG